jgi:hypothetical protein
MLRSTPHAASVLVAFVAMARMAVAQPQLPAPVDVPALPDHLTQPPPHAQPPPPAPPAPPAQPQGPHAMPPWSLPWGTWAPVAPVAVDLVSSTPGIGFKVFFEKSKPARDAPLATCPGNCRVFLHPGTYRFLVTETDRTLSGSRVIDVTGPMAIDFDPDTTTQRSSGLVMGIAGPIAMLVGFGLLIGDDLHDEYDERDEDETRRTVGGLLLIGGLAATPIGWVMFGRSFKPEYEIRKVTPPPAPSWSVGPGVTGSGLGLVGVGRF